MREDQKKKVLFIMGMEQKIERLIKRKTDFNPENILFIQRYETAIAPYSDVMRDIIIAVYKENVDEIFVVTAEEDSRTTGEIVNKLLENKELQEKLQTVDYLFENCMPEFPEGSISNWLEGGKTSKEAVRNNVNVIRNHPLMPSHVKVNGLFIDGENEQLSEIRVS